MRYLLSFLFVILFASAKAQTVPTGVPQVFGGKYYQFKGYVLVDSLLLMPCADTNYIPNKPALVYKCSDSAFYAWDLVRWRKLFRKNDLIDSLKFYARPIGIGRVSQINLFGNSISQGLNAAPVDSAFYNMAADSLKAYLQNYALSGMGVYYACQKHDSIVNGAYNNAATFVMVGYNDARVGSVGVRTYKKIASGIKAMFLNHFANYYIPASTTPTDTSVTRYGTWSVALNATIWTGKSKFAASTSTLNDSIVWVSQPATTIGVNLIGGDSTNYNHSIVELFIDNVSYGVYNTNNVADNAALVGNPDQRISYPIIIGGLTNVSHRVKLVNNAARIMYVDYFTALDSKKPSFVIFHNINPAGGSTGAQGAANQRIDSMFLTLPTGFPAFIVRTNNFFNPATGLDVDGVHPNNRGHYQIYNAWRSAYDSSVAHLPGTLMFDGRNLWIVGGGTNQKLLNPSDAWTKGDAAINAAGYINVPANMSYKQGGLDILKTDHPLFNTRVGALALSAVTTASGMTAIGYQVLAAATTGGANTGVGYRVMELLTTGVQNTGLGYFSIRNVTGDRNTAIGFQSLFNLTSGADNVGIGANSLTANTASFNTAVGSSALVANTSGSQNVALGYRALNAVQTGSNNIGIGANTERDNTGSLNTGVGSQVMFLKVLGDNNTIVGAQGFQTAAGGNAFSNNTGLGFQVGGTANTTGSNNIFLGYRAGDNITGASNNILLCYDCDVQTATSTGYTSIANTIFIRGTYGTGTTVSTNTRIGFKRDQPVWGADFGTSIGIDVDSTNSVSNMTSREVLTLNTGAAADSNRVERITAANLLIAMGVTSGTYTPTLTNVANISASTAMTCRFLRVGNVVTVSGSVQIDAVASLTVTQLGVSLPIASLLSAADQVSGTTGTTYATANENGVALGDATNDRAEIRFTATDVNNQVWYFVFTYTIL